MFEYESPPDGPERASRIERNTDASPSNDDAKVLTPKSGLYHQPFKLDEIFFKKAGDEKIIHNHNAYIVIGSDRPASDRDGYGAFAPDRAASIDLVVGRMASANGGKGPNRPAWVDNSFAADAARIHISQLTDIDSNFGLAKGEAPNTAARSGIGIKADAVRIIGREGVKIISGGTQGVKGYGNKGETNSLGGKIRQPSPEIALIAGNRNADRIVWGGFFNPRERVRGLQPLVLGYVARDAFMELSEILDITLSAVSAMALIQECLNSVIGTAVPTVAPAAVAANATAISFVNEALFILKANRMDWEHNYLWPSGYKFICSRNVKTT